MKPKALLMGGSGALGVYLTQELLQKGYAVDVVCLEELLSTQEDLRYIKADGRNIDTVRSLLANRYDAVVDFMIYLSAEEYAPFCRLYLDSTAHYVFLSSYRVYADEQHLITEEAPRLLDVSRDEVLLHSGDYCIYKARQEDLLRASGYKNWTILRPAITYSKRRFQLTVLEAHVLVHRMRLGKTVVLPEPAMDVQATLSWAGDFGKAAARLIHNPKAFCETYTVSTAEHHTWREMAEIYRELGGLKYVTVDTETFLSLWSAREPLDRQQLVYDRYFTRVIDNSKLLEHTGLRQADFMPLREGLKRELDALPADYVWPKNPVNDRMDAYLAAHGEG